METLLHAMGDVHPHTLKAQLARELSRITFERWGANNSEPDLRSPKAGKTIFCNSGFEAVEAALKTARRIAGTSRAVVVTGSLYLCGEFPGYSAARSNNVTSP